MSVNVFERNIDIRVTPSVVSFTHTYACMHTHWASKQHTTLFGLGIPHACSLFLFRCVFQSFDTMAHSFARACFFVWKAIGECNGVFDTRSIPFGYVYFEAHVRREAAKKNMKKKRVGGASAIHSILARYLNKHLLIEWVNG